VKVAGTVEVNVGGWRQVRGNPEVRFHGEYEVPLEPGERALLFLYDFKGDGRYALINQQGAYMVRGGAFASSGNPDPLVVALERKTPTILEDDVRAIARDVSRGRYRAIPYPGTG
jgi:hypothetical protein